MSLLKSVPVGWSIEEEFFSGYLRLPTVRMLEPDFPWIGEWRRIADSNQDPDIKASTALSYQQRMNDNAMEVTERLLSLRQGPVAMKVFPTHLEWSVLDEIIERWRPRVVILRRRLLFSYLSGLKAQETGHWFTDDNTSATFTFDAAQISRYISHADAWFDHVFNTCARFETPWLDLSFEDVIESDRQDESLFRFLEVDIPWWNIPDNASMVNAIYERDTRVHRLTILQSLLLITLVISTVLAPAWLAATNALGVQLILLLVWLQTLFVVVTQAGNLGWRATRWVNGYAGPAGDFDDSE